MEKVEQDGEKSTWAASMPPETPQNQDQEQQELEQQEQEQTPRKKNSASEAAYKTMKQLLLSLNDAQFVKFEAQVVLERQRRDGEKKPPAATAAAGAVTNDGSNNSTESSLQHQMDLSEFLAQLETARTKMELALATIEKGINGTRSKPPPLPSPPPGGHATAPTIVQQQEHPQKQEQEEAHFSDTDDLPWMSWYDKLVRFKERHGHLKCRSQNPKLDYWVWRQIYIWRKAVNGQIMTDRKVTDRRIALLIKIGLGTSEGPFTSRNAEIEAHTPSSDNGTTNSNPPESEDLSKPASAAHEEVLNLDFSRRRKQSCIFPLNRPNFYNCVVKPMDGTKKYFFVVNYNEDSNQIRLVPLEVTGAFKGRREGRPRYTLQLDVDVNLVTANTKDYRVVPSTDVARATLVARQAFDVEDDDDNIYDVDDNDQEEDHDGKEDDDDVDDDEEEESANNPRNDNMRWMSMYNQAVSFKKEHGHLQYNLMDKSLAAWIRYQRYIWRKALNEEKGGMKKHARRIEFLIKIGMSTTADEDDNNNNGGCNPSTIACSVGKKRSLKIPPPHATDEANSHSSSAAQHKKQKTSAEPDTTTSYNEVNI